MSYPKLVINRKILLNNVKDIITLAKSRGVEIVAVIKGINGNPGMMETVIEAGAETLASSQLEQLRKVKKINPEIKTYALRIPMLSEVEELVESADISLNSELEVLEKINEACLEKDITHDVIIMCELGDLREGIYDKDELEKVAKAVEFDMDGLHLLGIGTNLGCYGSILPTVEKMNELVERAHFVNKVIGREVEVISGGATTSFPLVAKGLMPKEINQLRMGEGLFINALDDSFKYSLFDNESLVLQAEIIELKTKPSYPIGEIAVNAFGDKVKYEDKGVRKRAILALGSQDIGDYNHLRPLDKDIDVIGGSSDYTIIDVTESETEYHIGDIVEFHLKYGTMMMATQSEYIEKEFI